MPDLDPGKTGTDPQYFTAEDLEKARREAIEQARKEERDKLYSQRDRQKESMEAMQAEVAELRKAEAERTRESERRAAAAEKARKEKEDAEKSAKELLAEREQTWQQKLDAMRAEQESKMAEIAQQQQVQQAMWEKEREMTALQIYIRDAVAAEQDNIAPELLDFIGGNTREEVDASIQRVKDKTAAIVEGMRQAQMAGRAGMTGVSPSGGATAVVPGIDTGDQKLTAEDIKGMSMQDFAALRQKVGMPSGSGRGIFS